MTALEPNLAPTGAPKAPAIVQLVYGTDPERVLGLAEVDQPTIGADQVLVRVSAASVDRGTWHCMTGEPYAMRLAGFGVRAPKASNPGRAMAGTVEAVGAAVTELRPGDEVYGSCDGAFARYVRRRGEDAGAQAGQPLVRRGGHRAHLRGHRPAGRSQGEGAVGPPRAGRGSVWWGRQLRRPDRQGPRRARDRRVPHGQGGLRPLARRRCGHRLHGRGPHRRR